MKKKNEISKSADSQSEFMNNKTTIDYHKSIENSDGKEMYQNSELNQYIKIEELKQEKEIQQLEKINEEQLNSNANQQDNQENNTKQLEQLEQNEQQSVQLPPVVNQSKFYITPHKQQKFRQNKNLSSPYQHTDKRKNLINKTINQSVNQSIDKQVNNSTRKNKSSDKHLNNSNSTRSNIVQNKNNQMLLKIKQLQFKSKKLPKYYFLLGNGNNVELVRKVLQTRPEWNEVSKNSQINPQLINFKWQQNSWGYHYEKLTGESGINYQLLNHFEFHKELTTKSGLVKNLQRNLQTPFDMTPLTYIITLDNNIDTEFQWFTNFYFNNCPFNNGKNYISIPNAKIFYSYSGKKEIQNVERNKSIKIVKLGEEFFDGDNFLWLLKPIDFNRGNGIHVFNKIDQLENLLNEYYSGLYIKQCKDENDSECEYEHQFVVHEKKEPEQDEKKELNDDKIKEETLAQDQLSDKKVMDQVGNDTNGDELLEKKIKYNKENQARKDDEIGIIDQIKEEQKSEIKVEELKAGEKMMVQKENIQKRTIDLQQQKQQSQQKEQQQQGFYVKCSQFVIQKYIERPFLINERKFDIRMWCLLTHQQVGFVFKEGYIRTSCEKFSLDDCYNPFVHLTNNAIQKHSKKYGAFEDGNQMSFQQFQNYLDSQENNKWNFKNTVSKLLQFVILFINSAYPLQGNR